jgi:hypothetical protein
MDSIDDVFEDQGLNKKLAKHQHYLVKIDGQLRAWMKHPNVPTIETSKPAKDSYKAWLKKGTNLGYITKVSICLFSNHNKSMECLQTH